MERERETERQRDRERRIWRERKIDRERRIERERDRERERRRERDIVHGLEAKFSEIGTTQRDKGSYVFFDRSVYVDNEMM